MGGLGQALGHERDHGQQDRSATPRAKITEIKIADGKADTDSNQQQHRGADSSKIISGPHS